MKTVNSKRLAPLVKWALALLAAAGVLCCMVYALNQVDDAQSREGRRILEDSLRRAAVSSYTSSGRYPATLEELTGRYGISVDTGRYAVYYEIFADNIMPDITVVPLDDEGGRG